MGGGRRLGWIVKNMSEKVKANYVINEGGGASIKIGGNFFVYLVDVSEEGAFHVKLKFQG